MARYKASIAALISGVLLVAGYSPFDLWPLAYIALVPLFMVSRSAGPVRAMGLYGLTGFVLAVGVFYGAIGYGVLALLLVTGAYYIAFALWGWLTYWILAFRPVAAVSIVSPALLWVGIETLSGSASVGMPMYLGLSQVSQTGLIQVASWFGISSVSFLIILVNTSLAFVLTRSGMRTSNAWSGLAVVAGSLLVLAGVGERRMVEPFKVATTIRVSGIQPVVDSETYRYGWQQPANRRLLRATVRNLTAQAVESGAQMVFWAEGGNGYMNFRVPSLRAELTGVASDNSVGLIVSSSDMDEAGRRFNAVFSISPTGQISSRYDKQRLVPLAEAELTPGVSSFPLSTTHGALGAVICYESSFPEPLRKLTALGAEILFVTSSDAAFKRSSLAFHHARLAVFRAVENGRWLIRVANTGPSLIVSPRGRIVAQTEFYARGLLTGDVAALSDLTFFTRVGYLLPKVLAAAVLGLIVYSIWSGFRQVCSRQHAKACQRGACPQPVRGAEVLKSVLVIVSVMAIALPVIVAASLYATSRMVVDSRPSMWESFVELVAPAEVAVADVGSVRFLQGGSNTCGAAALAYVLSYLGRETREEEVTDIVTMNERGTSMLELKRAAEQLEFNGVGVSEDYAALSAEALPVIAYIDDSHYVVVTRVGAQKIHLFDPAQGHIRLARRTFEQAWNGYLLLVRPGPIQGMEGRVADRKRSSSTAETRIVRKDEEVMNEGDT